MLTEAESVVLNSDQYMPQKGFCINSQQLQLVLKSRGVLGYVPVHAVYSNTAEFVMRCRDGFDNPYNKQLTPPPKFRKSDRSCEWAHWSPMLNVCNCGKNTGSSENGIPVCEPGVSRTDQVIRQQNDSMQADLLI